ncbi:MAG: 30S ribosomal protein S18 [Gammaproteobacteria bacterium]|nr:30S ribosomal protein S18 [Gammaproteobacteria bacterium]
MSWRTKSKNKKKACPFTSGRVPVKSIDYKNYRMLRKFVTETGKIVPSRMTGVTNYYQHKISNQIQLARYLALIPYCDNH